jgi:membrane protease YdiL (CAAX protease family)
MENKAYPKIKNAILLCLLLIGAQMGAGLIVGLFFGLLQINTESLMYGISITIINLVSFGLVIFIGFKKSKQKFNEVFKFNKVSLDYWVAIIIFMFGFIIVSSEIDNLLNYVLPMPAFLRDVFESMMVKQAFIVSILLIGIIPGIVEEMMFRGVILNGFQGNYSNKKAIVISALLFGIIHLNPWQFVTAFIIGIIAAWVYIKTKSIILCIYMHFFNNTISEIAIRYEETMSIKGFNTAYTEKVFQPIWFDIIGIIIVVVGILLIRRAMVKAKNVA